MGLGERISEAIEGSGKSKAQIAREVGVTGGAVSQWPTAKSLKAETALALEVATGYRAAWLLHGKGSKLVSERSPAWPFDSALLDRLLALNERAIGRIEANLEAAIETAEHRSNGLGNSPSKENVLPAENPTSEPISRVQDETPEEALRQLRSRSLGNRGSDAQRGEAGRKTQRTHGKRA